MSANSWHHIWDDLPVSDGEGNTYHYYVKEVSATTDGSVSEINAAYEYEDLSGTDNRIHKVEITNTTTVKQIDIHIHKVSTDTDDSGEVKDLQGAEFTLRKKAGEGASGGEYTVFNGCENQSSGADGMLHLTGLTPGDYLLTEDGAPAGYNRMTQEIRFTVGRDGQITGFTDTDMVQLDDGTFTFTVHNEPGFVLPSTGGTGTTLMYVLGILMAAGAGMAIVVRRRMRSF